MGKKLSGRGAPKLDKVFEDQDVHLEIPIDDLVPWIPRYEDRRIALARDSLASVDGFRILVHATYKYLFGLNYCWICPDCNADATEKPCQDICGKAASKKGEFLVEPKQLILALSVRSQLDLCMPTSKSPSNVYTNTRRQATS